MQKLGIWPLWAECRALRVLAALFIIVGVFTSSSFAEPAATLEAPVDVSVVQNPSPSEVAPKRVPFRIRHSKTIRSVCAAIVAALWLPGAVYQGYGLVTGQPHLGYRIMYDAEGVDNQLSDEEKAMFQEPAKNGETLVRDITDRISGFSMKYRRSGVSTVISGRTRVASEFLDTNVEDHGSCREASTVEAAIFRYHGIPAEVHSGWVGDNSVGQHLHTWVYFPTLRLVADPAGDTVDPAAVYDGYVSFSVDQTEISRWVGFR